MKITIKPSEQEEVEYRSDFSDKSFLNFDPHAIITFDFNYGSRFDGENLKFHLTDDEARYVLDFIKVHLSKNRINQMKNNKESIFIDDYE